jgi:hypothetical protein
MAAQYSKTSPYTKTQTVNGVYLDVWQPRVIPKMADDVAFKINTTYRYRPDLLAHDLYGDAGYWWVFAARNPNTIRDPIFDFTPGKTIYLPKKETLTTVLG